jgi:uncharacterized protein with NRDE domain
MGTLSNFLRLTQTTYDDNQPRRTDLQNRGAFCKSWTVCTLALFFRMFENFPLVLAANRDERYDRPSRAPAAIAGEPEIVAGIDLRAGGTWLGVNDRGIVAGILNRRSNGESSPMSDMRSRGHLCFDLLKCRSVADAESFLASHRRRYNPFTAVVADRRDALVVYNNGPAIVREGLAPGLHVFSSAAEVDSRSAKANRAYSLFAKAGLGDRLRRRSGAEAIVALQPVLADHSSAVDSQDPGDAICVHREGSGTVSSSIVRLDVTESRFETIYCPGAPCRNFFGAALTLGVS